MTVETITGLVPHGHVVTFYAHSRELCASVADFLTEGLLVGDAAIVLAGGAHLAEFTGELARRGVDLIAARRDGALVTVSADDALSQWFVDGNLDRQLFDTLLGEMIQRIVDSGRRVRVYGELVALLWDAGNVTAAIELEEAWNELARRVPFTLLCGYAADSFANGDHGSLQHVCELHAAVVADALALGHHESLIVQRAEHARSFACNLQAPSAARQFVARTLIGWGDHAAVEDASIIVAELATNAVIHARSEFVVGVCSDGGAVRIAVRDTSSTRPVPQQPDVHAISGRGLILVSTLTQRWGTDMLAGGKVVWAELGH